MNIIFCYNLRTTNLIIGDTLELPEWLKFGGGTNRGGPLWVKSKVVGNVPLNCKCKKIMVKQNAAEQNWADQSLVDL